jgi:hypothetical protein
MEPGSGSLLDSTRNTTASSAAVERNSNDEDREVAQTKRKFEKVRTQLELRRVQLETERLEAEMAQVRSDRARVELKTRVDMERLERAGRKARKKQQAKLVVPLLLHI